MRMLESYFVDGRWFVFCAGDSTEDKPTADICDGSIFMETDTASISLYNENSSTWVPVGSADAEEETT